MQAGLTYDLSNMFADGISAIYTQKFFAVAAHKTYNTVLTYNDGAFVRIVYEPIDEFFAQSTHFGFIEVGISIFHFHRCMY